MEQFLTWEILATYGGAVVATMIVTQFAKKLVTGFSDKISFPSDLVSYVVALAVINLAALAIGRWTVSGLALSVVNAVVVTLAANKGYDKLNLLDPAKKAADAEATAYYNAILGLGGATDARDDDANVDEVDHEQGMG